MLWLPAGVKGEYFTGLNNFDVNSIVDIRHDEHFGFTEKEVRGLLKAYGLEQVAETMKEWYDGYRFGNADVYCPWDVINYAKKLQADPQAEPQAFWINTSGNDLVKPSYKTESQCRNSVRHFWPETRMRSGSSLR